MIFLPTVLLPAVFALCLPLLHRKSRRLQGCILIAGELLPLAFLALPMIHHDAQFFIAELASGLLLFFAVDKTALLFALLGGTIFLAVSLFSLKYFEKEEHETRFYTFILLSLSGFYGLCFSGNLITFYLFFELTTLLTFSMVLHEQTPEAMLGAKKYLFYSIGGALLGLCGILLILSEKSAPSSFSEAPLSSPSASCLFGGFLAMLGFSAKAGLFPLQSWLPSAHPVCPAPASALLSGLIVKAGILGVLRIGYFTIEPAAFSHSTYQIILLVLACLTVAGGSLRAYKENILKKRLAYSTVSNLSYILLGLFLFCEEGFSAALLHTGAHALAKCALFLCAGEMIFRTGKTNVKDLAGVGKKMPAVFVFFLLSALSLVGIPPFAGFVSKWYLCTAALNQAPGAFAYIIPVVLLFSALLTASYLFAPVISAFYPQKEEQEPLPPPEKGSPLFSLPLLALSVAGLLMGIFGV